jgi:hypothetical protein
MKQLREKKIGNVYVVLMNFKSLKFVCTRDEELEMNFIFLNSNLDRRQRGGRIRRGLELFAKREAAKKPINYIKPPPNSTLLSGYALTIMRRVKPKRFFMSALTAILTRLSKMAIWLSLLLIRSRIHRIWFCVKAFTAFRLRNIRKSDQKLLVCGLSLRTERFWKTSPALNCSRSSESSRTL